MGGLQEEDIPDAGMTMVVVPKPGRDTTYVDPYCWRVHGDRR